MITKTIDVAPDYKETDVNYAVAADLDFRVLFAPRQLESQWVEQSQVNSAQLSKEEVAALFRRIAERFSTADPEEIERDIEVAIQEVRQGTSTPYCLFRTESNQSAA